MSDQTAPTGRSPRRLPTALALGLCALIAVTISGVVGATVIMGRGAMLTALFGDPDTGRYDFDRPTRTPVPHDALACPTGTCDDAPRDFSTPVFEAEPEAVYDAVRAAVAALPSPDFRLDDRAGGRLRAVVRTPWIRFPDTVSAMVRRFPGGGTGLWLYSRSQIGRNDLGTNRKRLEAIVAAVRSSLASAVKDRP